MGLFLVIYCFDFEKLEIFIEGMKKELMKVIGNLVKYIDIVFEKMKEIIIKINKEINKYINNNKLK